MSRQVSRVGVFETNSSSCHSISFNSNYSSTTTLNSTMIVLGEYGWGYEQLVTPSDKLSYLVTFIVEYYRYYDRKSKQTVKWFDNLIHMQWLKDAIEDKTGESIEIDYAGRYAGAGLKNCYVDHQSVEILGDELILKDEQTFKEQALDIVFNNNIVIIIDNDNH